MLTFLPGKEEIDAEQNVSQLAPKQLAPDYSPPVSGRLAPSLWKISPLVDKRCTVEEKDICWSLTFRELWLLKEPFCVCVSVYRLSLLKFTLFERGENMPPEALSNSFGRHYTASRGRIVFSAWLCRPTVDVSWAFCLKPDRCILTKVASRCKSWIKV